MNDLRFDGKVVLVTGAGAGIGKSYALEFARRGASVVVNDLGSSPGGVGKSSKVADTVVQEIQKVGGIAVANYDSVEYGEKLIQTAINNFGKIDVVVNNAGILRDRTLSRMSEEEWDLIIKIHLKGAFAVTKAAWQHMKKQGYGRIIMTSSSSGIYGNFGQSNYSAAKLGLVGFANTLSLEGKKYGIHVNSVAPAALTRMTKGIIKKDEDQMKAEYIVPLVIYLCHDSCKETGSLFQAAAGLISKLRWQVSKGAVLREAGRTMTAEDVKENWASVTDWTDAEAIKSSAEWRDKMAAAVARVQAGDNDLGSTHPIRPNIIKKHKLPPAISEHNRDKVILYALGVGSSTNRKDHLKFLFENNEDFCALPSFGVIPTFPCLRQLSAVEGLKVNPAKKLHGEQYLEIFKPIPVEGKLISKMYVADVLDKGSGCVVITNVDTFDESGERVFFNQFVQFIVGSGGFRGSRSSDALKPVASPPKRKPDSYVEQKTNIDQAALYRLSGDYNPLHIDPAFAANGGFKEPILHGLCSFGYSTRHVMEKYGNNDPKNIKAIKVRFSKPVIPGQTLRTEMWKEGSRVYFQTIVVETGKASLTGAYVDLATSSGTDAPSVDKPVESSASLASDALFEAAASRLTPEIVRKVGCVFQWNITVDGKVAKRWEMDLSGGSGKIAEGKAKKADCTISISDNDVMEIFSGKLNPQQAFMTGKMKLQGNMMLAQKLSVIFDQHAKL